ncbi:hypothetical protein M440DRAFT_1472772 [Trichoderma longibrachiatum ATCC 18648]|uniref:Uncharacterized protein n=1 Tax=Trichoderma longibrachiatum ATCC 18648 TaxID=983965 RepID=A0A2T4BSV7_TRILO|nr:hypothetical protein M440DRAFT_1472772 [Trichoderma longibrachiatum ATCC 18648]
MPSLTLPTSASTETLLLKCQKETHKPPLPPIWTTHPPNQEIHPPPNTLALAIRIDAAAPTSIRFYESATNRPVGAVGPEFRGSLVLVPWRPGLKFVIAPSCRRKDGCLVGIIREGKAGSPGRASPAETPRVVSRGKLPHFAPRETSQQTPQVVPKEIPAEAPRVVPKEATPVEAPQIIPRRTSEEPPQSNLKTPPLSSPKIPNPTPSSIPKITANMRIKATPKPNPHTPIKMQAKDTSFKTQAKRKSHIPIAVPKKPTDNGNAQNGEQARPLRQGTAIPSPVSSGYGGSRKRKHVSFDDAAVVGKRSSKMAMAVMGR